MSNGLLFPDPEPEPVTSFPFGKKYPEFNRAQSRIERDDAVSSVETHADESWKSAARSALREIAVLQAQLTSDDVWACLQRKYPDSRTHEPRAMGPIMMHGRREKWITPTSEFRATEKASQHAQPIRVWRSLICGVIQ